jgi:hypothetical protein
MLYDYTQWDALLVNADWHIPYQNKVLICILHAQMHSTHIHHTNNSILASNQTQNTEKRQAHTVIQFLNDAVHRHTKNPGTDLWIPYP